MTPINPHRAAAPVAPAGHRAQVRWPDEAAARVRSAPAQVAELRAGGAELHLGQPLRPGLLASVILEGPGGATRLVLARVTGCQECGAGEWAISCTFSGPLADDEFAALGWPCPRDPGSDSVPGEERRR